MRYCWKCLGVPAVFAAVILGVALFEFRTDYLEANLQLTKEFFSVVMGAAVAYSGIFLNSCIDRVRDSERLERLRQVVSKEIERNLTALQKFENTTKRQIDRLNSGIAHGGNYVVDMTDFNFRLADSLLQSGDIIEVLAKDEDGVSDYIHLSKDMGHSRERVLQSIVEGNKEGAVDVYSWLLVNKIPKWRSALERLAKLCPAT